MANKEHNTAVPQSFLLIIAAHGNMGDGELPALMRVWAQRECARLGLMSELKTLQEERIRELSQRLTNVMGKEPMDWIKSEIDRAVEKLS